MTENHVNVGKRMGWDESDRMPVARPISRLQGVSPSDLERPVGDRRTIAGTACLHEMHVSVVAYDNRAPVRVQNSNPGTHSSHESRISCAPPPSIDNSSVDFGA